MLSCIHHLKPLPKIRKHIPVEPHLPRKDHPTLRQIGLSQQCVDPYDSVDIVDVAEDEEVEFVGVFGLELLVEFLHDDFFVDFAADVDEAVGSEGLVGLLFWVV
jgi:hypothetical protein